MNETGYERFERNMADSFASEPPLTVYSLVRLGWVILFMSFASFDFGSFIASIVQIDSFCICLIAASMTRLFPWPIATFSVFPSNGAPLDHSLLEMHI